MTNLIIGDRDREAQLLERCMRLEHTLALIRRRLCEPQAFDAEIVQLRDVGRLTFRQIGIRLGMPDNTVRYRYYRSCGST